MAVEQAYNNILPLLEGLHARVREALGAYASQNDFLMTGRVKTLASILDKVESGRYASLEDLDDLVAFAVIVDTRVQVRDVIAHVRRTFEVMGIRGKSTLSDERIFDFDAIRIYARLNTSVPSPLSRITFEIQVRTLLQHAWSKITHRLVYKAREIDPRRIRLASEVLASLESVDRTLSTFSTVAKGVKRVTRQHSVRLNKIVELIDGLVEEGIVPAEKRPENGRRFSENVLSLVSNSAPIDDVVSTLDVFYRSQAGKFPQSVSLLQLATVAFHRAGMLRSGAKAAKRYHYVTADMLSLFPEVGALSPTVKV